eukprot:Nk52_evm22s230 gene=Nk52_evmTU22s230
MSSFLREPWIKDSCMLGIKLHNQYVFGEQGRKLPRGKNAQIIDFLKVPDEHKRGTSGYCALCKLNDGACWGLAILTQNSLHNFELQGGSVRDLSKSNGGVVVIKEFDIVVDSKGEIYFNVEDFYIVSGCEGASTIVKGDRTAFVSDDTEVKSLLIRIQNEKKSLRRVRLWELKVLRNFRKSIGLALDDAFVEKPQDCVIGRNILSKCEEVNTVNTYEKDEQRDEPISNNVTASPGVNDCGLMFDSGEEPLLCVSDSDDPDRVADRCLISCSADSGCNYKHDGQEPNEEGPMVSGSFPDETFISQPLVRRSYHISKLKEQSVFKLLPEPDNVSGDTCVPEVSSNFRSKSRRMAPQQNAEFREVKCLPISPDEPSVGKPLSHSSECSPSISFPTQPSDCGASDQSDLSTANTIGSKEDCNNSFKGCLTNACKALPLKGGCERPISNELHKDSGGHGNVISLVGDEHPIIFCGNGNRRERSSVVKSSSPKLDMKPVALGTATTAMGSEAISEYLKRHGNSDSECDLHTHNHEVKKNVAKKQTKGRDARIDMEKGQIKETCHAEDYIFKQDVHSVPRCKKGIAQGPKVSPGVCGSSSQNVEKYKTNSGENSSKEKKTPPRENVGSSSLEKRVDKCKLMMGELEVCGAPVSRQQLEKHGSPVALNRDSQVKSSFLEMNSENQHLLGPSDLEAGPVFSTQGLERSNISDCGGIRSSPTSMFKSKERDADDSQKTDLEFNRDVSKVNDAFRKDSSFDSEVKDRKSADRLGLEAKIPKRRKIGPQGVDKGSAARRLHAYNMQDSSGVEEERKASILLEEYKRRIALACVAVSHVK